MENCLFEYTAGIGPQYYIGGIDAHGAKNWIVRGNTFRNIASPSGSVAEFAVHFWNGSANNTSRRTSSSTATAASASVWTAHAANSGGVIRNNMIYHSANSHPYRRQRHRAFREPELEASTTTRVYQANSYPWAIEYRFGSTSGIEVSNNLVNKQIVARDGASGTVSNNVTNAAAGWFVSSLDRQPAPDLGAGQRGRPGQDHFRSYR